MTENRWTYYNGALIPRYPETDQFDNVSYREVLKEAECTNKPMFVMYPTDFDCKQETQWWYTINDRGYDIASTTAKRRYEINKGVKNFIIRLVDPTDCIDELVEISKAAFEAYPAEYHPDINSITREWFEQYLIQLNKKGVIHEFYAAYNSENHMCGFLHIEKRKDGVVNLNQQKVIPAYEKLNINFALLHFVLSSYNDDIKAGKVVFSNGQRNIRHKTAFNDFLCKYFGFRKAYARLYIKFPPVIDPIIKFVVRLLPHRWLKLECKNRLLYSAIVLCTYVKISQSANTDK